MCWHGILHKHTITCWMEMTLWLDLIESWIRSSHKGYNKICTFQGTTEYIQIIHYSNETHIYGSEICLNVMSFQKAWPFVKNPPNQGHWNWNIIAMSICVWIMYSVHHNESHSQWQWQQSVIVLLIIAAAAASSVSTSECLWWKDSHSFKHPVCFNKLRQNTFNQCHE